MIFYEPRITVVARPAFAEPSHLPVEWRGEGTDGERLAEFAGRLCYMSQRNPAGRNTRDYLPHILKQGHGSVLEHANYSLLLEGISRSLTHELVRHRAGFAYSQLSQPYVDESDAALVVPPAIIGDASLEGQWRTQVESTQRSYVALVEELIQRCLLKAHSSLRSPLHMNPAVSYLELGGPYFHFFSHGLKKFHLCRISCHFGRISCPQRDPATERPGVERGNLRIRRRHPDVPERDSHFFGYDLGDDGLSTLTDICRTRKKGDGTISYDLHNGTRGDMAHIVHPARETGSRQPHSASEGEFSSLLFPADPLGCFS